MLGVKQAEARNVKERRCNGESCEPYCQRRFEDSGVIGRSCARYDTGPEDKSCLKLPTVSIDEKQGETLEV